MKRALKILSLVLALLLAMTALIACDSDKKKNDDDDDEVIPASDPQDAYDALEDNGYTVNLVEYSGDCEAMISASKDEDFISINWYKESADAREAYNDAKEELQELKDALEDMKDELGDEYASMKKEFSKYVVGRDGKMVWSASSEDVVEDAQ
ncbi:MAG: hypothetical protein IJW30_03640 [Clostridia bacterium]|nr:hypothetical protein [Clostridia bacterium]